MRQEAPAGSQGPEGEQAPGAEKLAAVAAVFHAVFADEEVTLAGGFPEPFYRAPCPAGPTGPEGPDGQGPDGQGPGGQGPGGPRPGGPRPGGQRSGAEIRFTRDYLNSSLHEIAHWCIAGRERRRLDDYGYWYRPDGRNGSEQAEFFRAEAAPQSLEWAFAMACGEAFRMSCDNLAGEASGHAEFAAALRGKLAGYLEGGFPVRAGRFLEGLLERFHPGIAEGERLAWLRSRAEATDLRAG
ncbi:MAG TPA: elongation factor P hydroxylase [Fibrobacteria bacterium]|nr:elongation factor P hydroxylase [Fibrobacteria bacterium]